jgi:hypothetical protein
MIWRTEENDKSKNIILHAIRTCDLMNINKTLLLQLFLRDSFLSRQNILLGVIGTRGLMNMKQYTDLFLRDPF